MNIWQTSGRLLRQQPGGILIQWITWSADYMMPLLLLDTPTLRATILLSLAIWCFCRFYYFAFYVIEHYIDPTFKYAGLWSAAVFLFHRRNRGHDSHGEQHQSDRDAVGR